jgi:hypothetical protein
MLLRVAFDYLMLVSQVSWPLGNQCLQRLMDWKALVASDCYQSLFSLCVSLFAATKELDLFARDRRTCSPIKLVTNLS